MSYRVREATVWNMEFNGSKNRDVVKEDGEENGCNVGERTEKEKDMLSTVTSPSPRLNLVQVLSLFFTVSYVVVSYQNRK